MLEDVCTPWASADDATCCGKYAELEAAAVEPHLIPASNLLYRLSGFRWPGICEGTYRPCRAPGTWDGGRRSPTTADFAMGYGAMWQPSWGTCGCGGNPEAGQCGCGPLSRIRLNGQRLISVSEVKIDGVVLTVDATSGYRVDNGTWLTRLPNVGDTGRLPQHWPCCQRLDLTDDEVGTWSVTARTGALPGADGVKAAARLAGELALDCAGGECELPSNIRQVTRQGETWVIAATNEFLAEGRTGIGFVDLWLASLARPGRPVIEAPNRPGATAIRT